MFACLWLQAACNIEAVTANQNTALHLALGKGHTRIVERLVGYGSSLNCKDKDGDTPLHITLLKKSIEPLSDETPQLKLVIKCVIVGFFVCVHLSLCVLYKNK